jgi:hypothetical protein
MRKKKAPVSLATARAISVLPVPGGPNNKIPRGGWRRNAGYKMQGTQQTQLYFYPYNAQMNCMYIFILLSSSPIFPDVAEVLKS